MLMSTSMTALCCLFRSISSGLEFHLSLCSELPLQTSLLAHHHCHQKQTQAQTHLSSCKSSYIYNVSPLSPLICNVHGIYRPACTISDCRIVKISFTRLLICAPTYTVYLISTLFWISISLLPLKLSHCTSDTFRYMCFEMVLMCSYTIVTVKPTKHIMPWITCIPHHGYHHHAPLHSFDLEQPQIYIAWQACTQSCT